MSTYTIRLPWDRPPLSLNDSHGNRHVKARKVREIRADVYRLALLGKLPRGATYCTVQLHYQAPDRRRRDTDNLAATAKPIYDALTFGTLRNPGYGLVLDDTPEHMQKPEPIIHPAVKDEHGAMWLEITTEVDAA